MKQPKLEFQKIPISQLTIHPTANRGRVNNAAISRISQNLYLGAIGVIHAVQYQRDGQLGTWVVDGQHRIMALKKSGYDELKVDVWIHHDVTDDAAASRLFLDLNNFAPLKKCDYDALKVVAHLKV